MKIENQTPQHAELLQLFTTEFEKYYRHMDAQTLRGLLRCAPMVFAKWYHTALAAETILTPANIVSSDLRNTKNTETAYVLSIHNDAAGLEKYHFRLLTYCVDNHPLLTDLQILADFFLPRKQIISMLFIWVLCRIFTNRQKKSLVPLAVPVTQSSPRRTVCRSSSCLYFCKDQYPIFLGNDINFSPPRPIVLFQYRISLFPHLSDRQGFSRHPDFLTVCIRSLEKPLDKRPSVNGTDSILRNACQVLL